MSKGTTIKDAIKNFESEYECVAAETEKVLLYGQVPPIDKMDATLGTLKACTQLSLSTNSIEKITGLQGLENLAILSLGRNLIKKIENVDVLAGTLRELWISYNSIKELSNVDKLINLKVLYVSNNKIESWKEVDRLSNLKNLEDLLLAGNPLQMGYEEPSKVGSKFRIEVLKRCPGLKKLDGIPVELQERQEAGTAQ